jgi:hypothetical protein
MGADDRGADQQPLKIDFSAQHGQDLVQNAARDPAIIAPLHGPVVAQALRQIAPARARAGHPEQSVHEAAVIAARAALPPPPARDQVLDALPLVVPQRVRIDGVHG